jgi:hypothetical protein
MIMMLSQDNRLAMKIANKQVYVANKYIIAFNTLITAAMYSRKCTCLDKITIYLKLQDDNNLSHASSRDVSTSK